MAKLSNPKYPGQFSLQVLVNKELQREGSHDDVNYVVLPTDVDYELLVTVPPGEWSVVISVDGLDITDGQRKPVDKCGAYIMRRKNAAPEPRESGNFVDGDKIRRIIRGYRIDNESVATFRTGRRKDAYASVLGEPENVGVIGIAFVAGYCDEPPPAPRRALESCEESVGGGGFERYDGGATRSIGTSFGSKVEDKVRTVQFVRTGLVGVLELFYDREEVLEARGIAFPQPSPEDRFQFRRGCPIPPGWTGR
jgi:hypothetical protein